MSKYTIPTFWKELIDATTPLEAQLMEDKNYPEYSISLPRKLKEYLDTIVIGQDEAKRILAVSIFQRDLRILSGHPRVQDYHGSCKLDKSNILMLGPTGCGKTLLLKATAQFVDCPLILVNAASFTSRGYYGKDLSTVGGMILDRSFEFVRNKYGNTLTADLFQEKWQQTAENCIVFFDEFDKLHTKERGPGVHSTEIQEELLKFIEGEELVFTNSIHDPACSKHAGKFSKDRLYTDDILFVCGGSFHGLEEIVAKRLNQSSIGFMGEVQSPDTNDRHLLLTAATNEDFIKFGMIPELIGRLPARAVLNPLNEEQLIAVLTEPKNSIIEQVTYQFNLCQRQLNITHGALQKIAQLAIKTNTGARALKSILDKTLLDLFFTMPDDPGGPPITITEKEIQE